jgi:hypothetical protein
LLAAISRSDFHSSSKILQTLISERRTHKLAKYFQTNLREKRGLRIRDHVAHFLSIGPVYCALEIPSYELLDIVKGAGDRHEAAQLMFEHTRDLVENQSPSFNSNAVRVEKAASSAFSVFLPEILQKRILEIRDCKVPYTVQVGHKYTRTLYYIGFLLNTKYGNSILRTIIKSDAQSVVEEENWNKIASTLSDLSFEPDSMYEEIPSNDWFLHVKSLDKTNSKALLQFRKHPTNEIDAIRRLEAAIRAWERDGTSDFFRFNLLDVINKLRTRHYNEELIQQLPTLAPHHQETVIDILVNTLDPASEKLLNRFLESKSKVKRKLAARGLARLNALESPISVSDPTEADSIDAAELMASAITSAGKRKSTNSALMLLAKSRIPRVRKDLARILVELHDRETSDLFFQLVSDSCEEVGMEVVSHIERLPADLAKDILEEALHSSHERIVAMAEEAVLDFGGFEQ